MRLNSKEMREEPNRVPQQIKVRYFFLTKSQISALKHLLSYQITCSHLYLVPLYNIKPGQSIPPGGSFTQAKVSIQVLCSEGHN